MQTRRKANKHCRLDFDTVRIGRTAFADIEILISISFQEKKGLAIPEEAQKLLVEKFHQEQKFYQRPRVSVNYKSESDQINIKTHLRWILCAVLQKVSPRLQSRSDVLKAARVHRRHCIFMHFRPSESNPVTDIQEGARLVEPVTLFSSAK
jgi:hypothetical protein